LGAAPVILGWLPVLVPWAGAALLLLLPRRPVLVGPAVAAASLGAAVALVAAGGPARPSDALGSALLLAGAAVAFLAVVAGAASGALDRGDDRFSAAGFPLLQGAQAMALLAVDAAAVWLGLAVCAGAGAALVARSGGRRAFAAAWRMVVLCGAGLALALLGVALLHARPAGAPGVPGLGLVLVMLGYGALAGLAPLHAWLPRATAVSTPPVAAVLAGLLPPAALHALLRAAAAAPVSGVLPPAALLAALGLATALLAGFAAWRRAGAAPGEVPGWSGAGLAGFAAVGFGLGGAAGALAGVLLLLGLPFCVGAAVLGAAAGGPVAALGRVSLAGMPPFAPFVALVLLFSAAAALPAELALPLGAALLAAAGAQLGAAAALGRGGALAARAAGAPAGLFVLGPPWLLLCFALVLGAALPESVAAALAEAARLAR
jgi:hydrogenase-4 component F